MSRGKANKTQVSLSVIIHTAASAIRFGGDGYMVTFAGTEADKEEAAKLILLKGMLLRINIEVEDGQTKEGGSQAKNEGGSTGTGRRPWLERKSRAKADA